MSNPEATIEIKPGVFEPLSQKTIDAYGEKNAGFFHSLGRALGGENVDNAYLKSGSAVKGK